MVIAERIYVPIYSTDPPRFSGNEFTGIGIIVSSNNNNILLQN